MTPAHPFPKLMNRLREGDDAATTQVFNRFAGQILALARKQLHAAMRPKLDPEDVLQSVFRSFFTRHREGRFDIENWNSLWGILMVMTLRKCGRRIQYYRAGRRDARREVSWQPALEEAGHSELCARDSTPAETAMLNELLARLMHGLPEDDRVVLTLHLQGYTIAEIKARTGRSMRTVGASLNESGNARMAWPKIQQGKRRRNAVAGTAAEQGNQVNLMSTISQAEDRLADAASPLLDKCVRRFETAWEGGKRPILEEYLPSQPKLREAVLIELIHIDLEFRLDAGEAVRVETYLQRYPELASNREVVLELIAAEFEQRQRLAGPTVEEYLERFPEYRAELVLNCQPRQLLQNGSIASIGGRGGRQAHMPSDAAATQSPGMSRLGKFHFNELLGSGAFGNVYKAWDSELERTVALKVPCAGRQTQPEEMERFIKEARSAARLQHPGIVALHEAGQIDGTCFIASEFVAGSTLANRCQRGPLPPREAAEILAATAEALHYAHQQGVIHRDIKPSNILLDVEGKPHLTDFGLAKRDRTVSAVTLTGQVLGTPAYMSPEQARGDSKHVDARSDVYSLGVVLYQVLTGMLPFPGGNLVEFVRALEDDPVPPRQLNSNVPRDLDTVCLRAMSRQPSRRYASAAAFAEDLRRYLVGWPVNARRVGRVVRFGRWSRRKLLRPFLLAAIQAIVIFMTVLGTTLWLGNPTNSQPAKEAERRDEPAPPAKSSPPAGVIDNPKFTGRVGPSPAIKPSPALNDKKTKANLPR